MTLTQEKATRATHEQIQDLAFAHRQYYMNEQAYENKLITTAMYEYAKIKLQAKIDNLSEICYALEE